MPVTSIIHDKTKPVHISINFYVLQTTYAKQPKHLYRMDLTRSKLRVSYFYTKYPIRDEDPN
ncbi:hypothetical protein Pla110_10960 [Polystyrenella longa]|uniref:Uncharacterized protein n=1 Tax=Polystyrenella longa TaxID=2528007 RepID=A0A518CJH7_9PLAN|nr:hypothetical protein Pla110_10960 [Polystyrenella longa]